MKWGPSLGLGHTHAAGLGSRVPLWALAPAGGFLPISTARAHVASCTRLPYNRWSFVVVGGSMAVYHCRDLNGTTDVFPELIACEDGRAVLRIRHFQPRQLEPREPEQSRPGSY